MTRPFGERLASWNRYLALAGGVLLLAGLATLLIRGGRLLVGEILMAAGVVLLLAAWVVNPGAVLRALASRATRYGGSLALMSLALIGIVVLLNVLSYRHYGRWDLTEEKLFSLSPQTEQVLDMVDRPVQVTGFFYPEQRSAETSARDRLEACAAYNHLISYRIVDPEVQPTLAEQYDVPGGGQTLVFESGDKRHKIYSVEEQEITSAILKVTRDRVVTVYFLGEHGEGDIENTDQDGYSTVRYLLEDANYRVETLELATFSGPLPVTDTVVVIAGPRYALLEVEEKALADYLDGGGKLLVLLDPIRSPDLSSLLDPWGLFVQDSLIVEPIYALGGTYVTTPVPYYVNPDHPITWDLPATFYPEARPVGLLPEAPAGLTATLLLGTTEAAWGETDLESETMTFDAEEDDEGPLYLAACVQGRMHGSDQPLDTRVVLVGDSDFASNSYVEVNYLFFLNAVNWLAEEEELIGIAPVEFKTRMVLMNTVQMRAVRYATLVAMPLLIVGIGAGVWWRRRKG